MANIFLHFALQDKARIPYKIKVSWVVKQTLPSENIEDVCRCVAYFGDEPCAVSGHTAIIHHNQDAKDPLLGILRYSMH